MTSQDYYRQDLAWVHHVGYADYVEQAVPGILRLLRASGLAAGDLVVDAGCGSGLLARALLRAGFTVHGVDASPAMIELAREHAPGAEFRVLRLPTGAHAGSHAALPRANAVVSTGHVLNYLDGRDEIARGLGELAQSLRPGGVLAIDLMTLRYIEACDARRASVRVEDDWVIASICSRPGPQWFERAITVLRRNGGSWRRSDERHRNLSFETADALQILRDNGIDAHARAAFGNEQLPEGIAVLIGIRGL